MAILLQIMQLLSELNKKKNEKKKQNNDVEIDHRRLDNKYFWDHW